MARQLFYKTPPGAPHLRHPRWLAEIGLLVVLTYRVACRSCETALLAFGNESSLQHSPPSRLSGVGCCFFFSPSFSSFFFFSVQQLRRVCAEVWSHLMMALIRRIPFALGGKRVYVLLFYCVDLLKPDPHNSRNKHVRVNSFVKDIKETLMLTTEGN